jgi:serine protease Do
MKDRVEHSSPNRRLKSALLASVFAAGIAGAVGGSALLADGHLAYAEEVQVPAPATTPVDFTVVVEKVRPAVVGVQVRTKVAEVSNRNLPEAFGDLPEDHPFNEFFRRFGAPPEFFDDEGGREPYRPRRGVSQGSGFFVSEDGYVVTNAHVVEDGEDYTVITDDGRELDAELVGTDPRTDLALLKVDGHDFTYVSMSEEEPKVGQWVLAVGNPFGLGGSVSAGIISAEGRDIGSGPYDNYLQIDAPVNRGNSGGPAFNTEGEVIGVNTAIYSPSGGNVGIAFAIPAKMVEEVVSDLRKDGVVTRGWLGVQIQPVTADIAESMGLDATEGAIVADAQPDGPAEGAGIQSGDIILKVDDEKVSDPKELSEMIAHLEPNTEVTITVLRDGKERKIDVKLGDLNDLDESMQANARADQPDEKANPASLDGLGLTVEENSDGDGVVITGVEDDSPAAETGIRSGDVIVSIGGKTVKTVKDVERGIADAQDQGRGAVLFKVEGENGARFVGVPFERG